MAKCQGEKKDPALKFALPVVFIVEVDCVSLAVAQLLCESQRSCRAS